MVVNLWYYVELHQRLKSTFSFMYWLHDMLIFILVFQKVKLVAIIEFSGLNQVLFGSFLIFWIFKTLEKVYIKTDGRVHSESQCLALAKIFPTEKFWKIFLEFVIICQRQLRGFSWSKKEWALNKWV